LQSVQNLLNVIKQASLLKVCFDNMSISVFYTNITQNILFLGFINIFYTTVTLYTLEGEVEGAGLP